MVAQVCGDDVGDDDPGAEAVPRITALGQPCRYDQSDHADDCNHRDRVFGHDNHFAVNL